MTNLDYDDLPDTMPATEEAIRKAQELRIDAEFDRLLDNWYCDEPVTQKISSIMPAAKEAKCDDQ